MTARSSPEAWTEEDCALFAEARAFLRREYRAHRHTVAAVVVAASGRRYRGICVDGLHSPCAETIAFGSAFSAGETSIRTVVAVGRRGVLSPCGNCRQMMIDYVPRVRVLVQKGRRRLAVRAEDLLPYAFRTFG